MKTHSRFAALGLTVLAVVLVACGPASAGPTAAQLQPVATGGTALQASAPANITPYGVDLAHLQLGLAQVATGFTKPVYVTDPRDGSGRLFVVEQTGRIKIVASGTVLPTPYLDLSSVVSQGGERGLLGLAFAPGFATNGRFYINYTNLAGDTVIQRCIADDPASDAPAITRTTILSVKQPYANHNGGNLQFGPDRYLYIGMGDGGSGGDPGNRAQNRSVLLGKMLRIDTGDRDTPATFTGTYRIPPSNPFVAKKGARKEIWAVGLRNPWRFSFDAATGSLWIGDVGQDKYEEVDFVAPGKGGRNFGWHVWEGNHRYTKTPKVVSKKGFTFPIVEYKHPYGECVTGGYVYRGSAYPALWGTYLYADYVNGWFGGVKRYSTTGVLLKTPQRAKLMPTSEMISSFGTDQNNELYACDWQHGVLYQVTGVAK